MRGNLLRATALTTATLSLAWLSSSTAQAFDWAGFYFGGQVGGNSGNGSTDLTFPDSTGFNTSFQSNTPRSFGTPFSGISDAGAATPPGYMPWPTSFGANQRGVVLGIDAGYNAQVGKFVYGLEGNLFWLGGKSSGHFDHVDAFSGVPDGGYGTDSGTRTSDLSVASQVSSLFTLAPRVGFTPTDRLMLFATGGLAVGRASVDTQASLVEQYTDAGYGSTTYDAASAWSGHNSGYRAGYMVGGGGEYALTNKITLNLQVLYYNLGRMGAKANGTGTYSVNGGSSNALTVQPFTVSAILDGIVATAGLNIHF